MVLLSVKKVWICLENGSDNKVFSDCCPKISRALLQNTNIKIMASTLRRFSRICVRIATERNNRTALQLHSRHERPFLLASRSVAACTNECCKDDKATRCWKCNSLHVHGHPEFFCRKCEVIQPPGEDVTYFEIMDWLVDSNLFLLAVFVWIVMI